MADSKPTASWLIPAIIAGTVSLAGVWLGAHLTGRESEADRFIEVSRLRMETLSSAENFDFQLANLILLHVLKPIDDREDFDVFAADVRKYVAERAPESTLPAATVAEGGFFEAVPAQDVPGGLDFSEIVRQFSGPERLEASNNLVNAYEEQPGEVISALIEGILPPSERLSYRVNLYVAFTLARISGGWKGTPQQRAEIESLQDTSNYRDPTFRRRVIEALENFVSI